jgi:hypothetical protein
MSGVPSSSKGVGTQINTTSESLMQSGSTVGLNPALIIELN